MRLIILLLMLSNVAFGQRTLLLEQMIEIKPKKYYEGQYIDVKLDDGRWHNVRIERNEEDSQSMMTDYGRISLNEISNVRSVRTGALVLSGTLYTFSASTAVYGSLLNIRGGNNAPKMENIALASGISLASGWLVKKLFKYKNYRIGKKNRLKIVDLSLY